MKRCQWMPDKKNECERGLTTVQCGQLIREMVEVAVKLLNMAKVYDRQRFQEQRLAS